MAERGKPRKSKGNPAQVHRERSGGRRLDPAFQRLAAGESKRPDRPQQRPRLNDPRPVMLLPGVANREARLVATTRLNAMKALIESGPENAAAAEALEIELAESRLLELWRGASITGFDAMVEDVLSMSVEAAKQAAQRGARRLDVEGERLTHEEIAAWIRCECAMMQHDATARVRFAKTEGGGTGMQLVVSFEKAAETFVSVGKRLGALLRDQQAQSVDTRRDRPDVRADRSGPRRDRPDSRDDRDKRR